MSIEQKIIKKLKKVIKGDVEIEVKANENQDFGHYSSTIAFKLAKIKKDNPETIALELKEFLQKDKNFFEKIEVVKPGFLNFFLKKEVFYKELTKVLREGKDYGRGLKKRKSFSLDYLDANPTGPIHLGHARSGFYGDVLANVLAFNGFKVSREFYVNNAKVSSQIRSLGLTALGKGEEYKHEQLLNILKRSEVKRKIKSLKDESEVGYYLAKIIHNENKKFLKKIAKINFDLFFEEQSVYDKGLIEKVIKILKRKKVVYEKDGALWFKASFYGDTEDRVLIRKDGCPTYVLPDVIYHLNRLKERKYDIAIDIFGADHYGYAPRLIGLLKVLGIKPSRIKFITTQVVRLTNYGQTFKMSKRKGIFITLEELIKTVGLDSVRFFFITTALDTHFVFDVGLAREKTLKNPVFYLQYAYVRAFNVLKKTKLKDLYLENKQLKLLDSNEDLFLIRKIVQWPFLIEEVSRNFQIHGLVKYGLDLARAFHNLYEKERIISEDINLTKARLFLTKATFLVLEILFDILGISKPKKM